jgi:mannose-6-phosphate isomerase-like protein (cupin superfamily)
VSEARFRLVELNGEPRYQRILEGIPQTHGMRSGRVFLEPGKSCGQHSTKAHEELLVFLDGKGRLLIEGQDPRDVGTACVCYIPPHTVHDVENTGEGPLTYIYCVAPVKQS